MSLTNTTSNTTNNSGRGRPKAPTGTVQLNKKPYPRPKIHNRSLSHNKVLNKLSTSSTPIVPTTTPRPGLNRSKSTDGLIRTGNRSGALKRNNRSLTKLTNLTVIQPLTKTVLNQSLKSNKSTGSLKGLNGSLVHVGGLKTSGRKGKAILKLNDNDNDNNDYEDMGHDNENEKNGNNNNNIENENDNQPEPETFPSGSDTGGESSVGDIAVLRPQHQHSSSPSTQSFSEDLIPANNLYGGSLLLSQSTGLTKKFDPSNNQTIHQRLMGNTNNNNNSESTSLLHADKPTYRHESSIESTNSESISGISFKANPIENTKQYPNNIAQPVTINKNVVQENSYQPNKSIFNNLQRNSSQYPSNKTPSNQTSNSSNNAIANDQSLQSYLQQSNQPQHNIETRTQQRLWLQRENSLMDVVNLDANKSNFSSLSLNNMMFAHNYNHSNQNIRDLSQTPNHGTAVSTPQNEIPPGELMNNNTPNATALHSGNDHSSSMTNINGLLNNHQNSIQSRTEFERLNREYLNVRRHLNPVGECLNRVEEITKNTKNINVIKKNNKKTMSVSSMHSSTNANTFKEFSPSFQEKEHEINVTLNKLWQEALVTTLSQPPPTNQLRTNPPQASQQLSMQSQVQRSHNPRGPAYGQNSYNNLRSPQTPTTRAVKLAAQAQAAQAANSKRMNDSHT